MLIARGSASMPKLLAHARPHGFVVARDVLRVDHHDMRVGQEIQRGRIVRPRRHHQGAGLGDAGERMATPRRADGRRRRRSRPRACAPCPTAARRAADRRRGGLASAGYAGAAAPRPRRARRRRSAASRRCRPRPRPSRRTASTRSCGGNCPRAGMTPRGCCFSRSATAARRAGSSPVTPSDWRIEAKSVARARHCVLTLRFHCAWKVCTSGAGKSRCRVQPPASGSQRKRPKIFPDQPERKHEQRHRDRIKPRPRREEAPRGQPRAHRRGREMPLEFALAPVAHQLRQRDAHRAHFLAAPAEGRGVRQMPGVLDADDARRQHRAHRPGIDPAIGMPADRRVDRAMVHAGAAADAAQHVAELAAEHRGAAVVEDDDVILVRPVRDRRRGAGRSRTWCRPTSPARSPSAPARAATATRLPASARPSRSRRARCARAARSASGRRCLRW